MLSEADGDYNAPRETVQLKECCSKVSSNYDPKCVNFIRDVLEAVQTARLSRKSVVNQ